MSALSAFFASLLAAWPAPAVEIGVEPSGAAPTQTPTVPASAPKDDAFALWDRLTREFREGEAEQVRIEQHIIWRISPIPGPARENMTALNPLAPSAPKLVERKMGECIPMTAIAGGRPQGTSRLLLFMRDRRMVAANLEKACSARDFYSGFYVDKPNSDGKLCVDRDRILARSGARCEITSFRLLVADD